MVRRFDWGRSFTVTVQQLLTWVALMKCSITICPPSATLSLVSILTAAVCAQSAAESLKEGASTETCLLELLAGNSLAP